jgi:DNA-binding NtrC family response regulator
MKESIFPQIQSEKKNIHPTVLIVEDESLIQWSLDHACAKAGYRTIVANSAELAVEFFSKNSVDIVISDIRLPNHDGINLAHSLRAVSAHVPIILVSTETDRVKEIHHDLDEVYFREKPFDLEEMVSLIHDVLNKPMISSEMRKTDIFSEKSHQ